MPCADVIRFACWSVRQIWPLLQDPRSRVAIETVERFIDGNATLKEVVEARQAAAYASTYASISAYGATDSSTYAADAATYAATAAANTQCANRPVSACSGASAAETASRAVDATA